MDSNPDVRLEKQGRPLANPLTSTDPRVFDQLVEAVDPASLLVFIESRMGPALRARLTPEDVWQEALLHAWRDRARCEWRGIKSFRRWLLQVIEHRLQNLADEAATLKRGAGNAAVPFSALAAADVASEGSAEPLIALVTTTPSRVASYREQAAAVRAALDFLDADLRGVVQLRLIEEKSMEEVARELGIGISAAYHRFYKGFESFERRLRSALRSRDAAADDASSDRNPR